MLLTSLMADRQLFLGWCGPLYCISRYCTTCLLAVSSKRDRVAEVHNALFSVPFSWSLTQQKCGSPHSYFKRKISVSPTQPCHIWILHPKEMPRQSIWNVDIPQRRYECIYKELRKMLLWFYLGRELFYVLLDTAGRSEPAFVSRLITRLCLNNYVNLLSIGITE